MPSIGGLGEEDRALEEIAERVHAEARPGDIDAVPLRAGRVAVRKDERLVVEDQWGVVVRHHAERESHVRLWSRGRVRKGAVEEGSPKGGVGLGDEDPARRRENVEGDAFEIGVAVRVHRQRRIACGIEPMVVLRNEPPEGRRQVAPVTALIEGVGDAAVIVAGAEVIRGCDHMIGVGGVDDDKLLPLEAEGAVLIHPDVVIGAREDVGTSHGRDRHVAPHRRSSPPTRASTGHGLAGVPHACQDAAGNQSLVGFTGGLARYDGHTALDGKVGLGTAGLRGSRDQHPKRQDDDQNDRGTRKSHTFPPHPIEMQDRVVRSAPLFLTGDGILSDGWFSCLSRPPLRVTLPGS